MKDPKCVRVGDLLPGSFVCWKISSYDTSLGESYHDRHKSLTKRSITITLGRESFFGILFGNAQVRSVKKPSRKEVIVVSNNDPNRDLELSLENVHIELEETS